MILNYFPNTFGWHFTETIDHGQEGANITQFYSFKILWNNIDNFLSCQSFTQNIENLRNNTIKKLFGFIEYEIPKISASLLFLFILYGHQNIGPLSVHSWGSSFCEQFSSYIHCHPLGK